MALRALTFADRVDSVVELAADLSNTDAEKIDRDASLVRRERKRTPAMTRGYRPAHVNCQAEKRRSRPQARKIDTDPVL